VSPSSIPRIFVVDDEPVIASTLAAILQMNGFSAKFFTCPLEALTAARSKRLICSYPTSSCQASPGLSLRSG
jgi:CheY-like chemotaxis protein